MKSFLASVATTVLSILIFMPPTPGSAQEPPTIIGPLKIGDSTTRDAIMHFGDAPLLLSNNEEVPPSICYHQKLITGDLFFTLEFAALGGGKLTGYQLTKFRKKGECKISLVNLSNLRTGNGIHLGITRREFQALAALDVSVTGDQFVMHEIRQRKLSPEEANDFHKWYPQETQDYISAVRSMEAKFQRGTLTEYSVREVESF